MRSFLHSILKLILIGAIVGAAIVTALTLIGFTARYWWLGETLSQLRPQYALALVLCLPFLLWRFRHAGWLTLIPLLLNVGTFVPLYFPPQHDLSPTSRQYTALHYNLDNTLPDHTAAFDYLRNHPVDILSLQELTPDVAARLTEELPGYVIAYSHPMTNSHGSVILVSVASGIEVRSADIIHLPEYSVRPIIEAMLDIDGHSVAFLSLHVIRPVSAWNTDFQQIEFASAAEWSRQQQAQGQTVLIMGDLNSTSWSRNFRQFQQAGQLHNSERGFGLEPTWPASLPALFTIPIDHCLYSPGIIIVKRFIGPFLGSDHAPIHIQFALAEK
jgi:endonuclease/exonuclease/phosphatase (EEP) superfamily protein YafD